MNTKNRELTIDEYLPERVLVIYGGPGDQHGYGKKYYIESRPVDENGNLLAARPLSPEEADSLAEGLAARQHSFQGLRFAGRVPSCFLGFSLTDGRTPTLIWTVPSQKRKMFFQDDLDIPCGEAYQQDLIFRLEGEDLSVYGYRASELNALGSSSPLYLPIYLNVDSEGSVCLGQAGIAKKLKATKSLNERMSVAEDAFFNSMYSHGQRSLTDELNFNLNQFWSEMISSGTPFPEARYIPMQITLKEILP